MKARILVVGSSNTDMIVRVPRIPKPGETILGGDVVSVSGGKGANQAVSAARAGGNVTLVARVGGDMFGERALAGFARNNIHTNHVIRDKHRPSGVALIFVANSGQNSIAVASGANKYLSQANVKQAERAFTKADILITQLETPLKTVMATARLAVKHGVPVILNPAPAQSLPVSLLRRVSILTPNETEAELLTNIKVTSDSAAARAAAKLRSYGVQTVVITLGVRGAFVADEDGDRRVPGFKVKAVDTTAAGDVFNGALAVSLSTGNPMNRAVRFANAAAALSVTHIGAQPSAPRKMAIDRFLKQHSPKHTKGKLS